MHYTTRNVDICYVNFGMQGIYCMSKKSSPISNSKLLINESRLLGHAVQAMFLLSVFNKTLRVWLSITWKNKKRSLMVIMFYFSILFYSLQWSQSFERTPEIERLN